MPTTRRAIFVASLVASTVVVALTGAAGQPASARQLASAGQPVARSAQAPPRGDLFLSSESVTVRTSTGLSLDLSVNVTSGDVIVFFARGSIARGLEEHGWDFVGSFFDYDRRANQGHLTASTAAMHGFGAMSLAVRRVSPWRAGSCVDGKVSRARFAMSGTLYFRTRTSGRQRWGQFGTRTHPRHLTLHATGETVSGCDAPNGPAQCDVPGVGWRTGPFDARVVDDNGRWVNILFASRTTVHRSVQRFDIDVVRVPGPVLHKTADGSQMNVRTAKHTRASGTATLIANGPGRSSSDTCTPRPNRQTITDWDATTATSTPLRMRMDVGADFTLQTGASTSFSERTVDPAP
jgi:hypothetical protein